MSEIQVYNWSDSQKIAIEVIAYTPGITDRSISDQVKVSAQTISAWRSNPAFIDACYNRYIEIAGNRLMGVMEAMFREAEQGSVPAAQLILKHYNKLNDIVRLEVVSPFEKFLQYGKIEDGSYGDMTRDLAIEIGSSILPNIALPPRNEENDKPGKRLRSQKKALKNIHFTSKKIVDRKNKRNHAYKIRKRAQAVGLELLSQGKQPDHIRRDWERKLLKLEKDMGI
jgi:hypothetical protein